jgi:formate hydrogenlyase subunit 3/multisubunit Na+/H+ antiporter MnhD subunit
MSFDLLLVPILVPLGVVILTLLIPKIAKWVREILTVLCTGAVFGVVLTVFLRENPELHIPLIEIGNFNLNLDLVVGPLSGFILLFAGGFALLIALFSLSYRARRDRNREYYAFLLFALTGSCGVLMSDHILFFLIFWEIVTASLYFLINTGGAESRAGATKTFAMLGAGDGAMLLGIGLLWYLSRTFVISELQIPINGALPVLAFLLLMLGAITKAGAMPLHSWIPAASNGAPAPVMAFLPAAVDKLLGIYLLFRIATGIFVMSESLGLVLMIIGAVTILAAVMVAMVQHDLRRLLSYHAISQVGYMLLGIGTMSPIGIAGGLFHMLNHSIYKSCLFLCSGSVEHRAGSTDLGELGGLAKVMPVTFASCLVAALAISGIPPFNGFVSKWMVYQGVIDTGNRAYFIFLIAAMFGSALTLASFIKVIYTVFLGERSERTRAVKGESSLGMQVPLIVLSLLCLIFGIFYGLPLRNFIDPSLGMTAAPLGIWQSGTAMLLVAIGLVMGLAIYWFGNLRKSVRRDSGFIGGETTDSVTRLIGTHFYDTVKNLPLLKGIYAAQERGRLDPYNWMGGLGLAFTGLLRKMHNGLLSWYLSWSLMGIVVLIFLALFLL